MKKISWMLLNPSGPTSGLSTYRLCAVDRNQRDSLVDRPWSGTEANSPTQLVAGERANLAADTA